MKSKEVSKEACMRIGNIDDLIFLLRKGNLSPTERIGILSRHAVEFYKKDADSTLMMLKKDLLRLLRLRKIPKVQLQDLVFTLAKFKKGRVILEELIEQLSKQSSKTAVKEIMESVLEENHYVYSESYEI